MSRECPSKFKIASSPTKEESKERKNVMDVERRGTLWKFAQTNLHPRQRRRQEQLKAKPSQQSRLGMIHQVKMKPNTRGVATSTHHQALHICALWHEVMKVLAQVIVIVMMSYLVMSNLCNKMSIMLKVVLANKRG